LLHRILVVSKGVGIQCPEVYSSLNDEVQLEGRKWQSRKKRIWKKGAIGKQVENKNDYTL